MRILTLDAIFNVKNSDFNGEKMENHHVELYRHIDMFTNTGLDPAIASDELEHLYMTINRNNRR